jgi:hypothetical protein
MRSSIALLLLVQTLCVASGTAWADTGAAPATTTWMSVTLNGRKIGQEEIQRQVNGDNVITTETLVMEIQRDDKTVPYTNISRSVETASGEPVSFSMDTTIAGGKTEVLGERLPDGQLQLTMSAGGDTHKSVVDWPTGAVLVEGQRLAMLEANQHPGRHYHLLAYNQASQQVMNLSIDVVGEERVGLPDGIETLIHQRETLKRSNGTQVVDLWLDNQGNIRKGSLSMLGKPFDLVACNQACAQAPSQSLDMMDFAMVDSPRIITPEMLDDFLRYRVHVKNKDMIKPFINTDEQSVSYLGNGEWEIDVYRGLRELQKPPTPQDTQPNAWLQSDAPEIRALAAQAAGDAKDKMHVMGSLSAFVSRYLTRRGLNVGYESALEVAKNRQGDCAEYAVLLAAMARAEGIPARVAVGMLYTDRYDDKSHEFVPHAWVIAWVDGRWRSFDPAAARFDSGHIALDTGDGNPWHFFHATDEFGSIQIDSVHTFFEVYQMPTAGGALDGRASFGSGTK